ncbi:MAG: universal stress protein [Gammaproteobacteria bacterium]|nr:universal stress protein [Gammaproteobacteria bacterium]
MTSYKNIVLALELVDQSDKSIIHKAKELAEKFNAKLTLVHSVEHFVGFGSAYSMPGTIDVEEEIVYGAQEQLAIIGEKLNVSKQDQVVKVGTAKHVIINEAKHINADLIIVGSHGRHGVRLLLGSTANAIIHAAHCDVLAVRVK